MAARKVSWITSKNFVKGNVGAQEFPRKLLPARLYDVSSSCLMSSSTGDDYQFLQKSIVPTMHFQKSLPRLPIPKLNRTCERYLQALQPLVSTEDFEKTSKIVQEFQGGVGQTLHDLLVRKDKANKHTSYISGPWFDMYLRSRLPLALNYNPFLGYKDDARPGYNDQVIRATNMLISSLRFSKSLRANVLEPMVYHLNPEKSDTKKFRNAVRWLPESLAWYGGYLFKAFPLDMSQFKNLFNTTRIPKLSRDEIFCDPTARHMLVIRNGHFYIFDVFDSDGNIFPPEYYHACISHIVSDQSKPAEVPLGVMTAENRDKWAAVRKELEKQGNAEQLRLIDSAFYALILDDDVFGSERIKLAHHVLHGPAQNRWFDKSLSLIITKEGKAAVNFEHSWGDGVAVLRFFNDVFDDSTKNSQVHPNSSPASIDAKSVIKKLEFSYSDSLKASVSNAFNSYKESTDALRIDVLEYDRLNRDFIKDQRLSPDSIMQLAFQLGFYKQNKYTPATYESCSTSAFKHGRTETVRPATMITKQCVEAMCSESSPSPIEIRKMIDECSKVHNSLTKDAALGQGFDRHLFGLKVIAEETGSKLPDLYTDPSFIKANHFVLSTSTLFGPAFSGGGFGPVVRDGYGIGYGMAEGKLGIIVTSYSPERDGAGLVSCMESGLNQVCDVLVAAKKASSA